MRIGGRTIGPDQPVFVIAEIGVNHDGSVDRALELVRHAARAGADAVKLQIFTAQSLMHPTSRLAEYQADRVAANDASAMLREYELSTGELRRIVDQIRSVDLLPLATPFSPQDVVTIEQLNLPAIKIASPDLVNQLLLARAAATDKPIILSTGAAAMQEVEQTVAWMRHWRSAFMLMHCVSSYPAPAAAANLSWIRELARFDVPVGYSDHTTELLAGAMSVCGGACVVEKHLTYDRRAEGPDHSASADPDNFREYVRMIRLAQAMRGRGGKHVLPIERDVRSVSRQSLVLTRDLERGQVIHMEDLTVQRPGSGIPPSQVAITIGRPVLKRLTRGTLLKWDMLSDAA